MNEILKEIARKSSEIDEVSADMYRISLILRLCANGMQHLSEAERSMLHFKHDTIGDALEVLCDKLDECRSIIVDDCCDIETATRTAAKMPA